MFEKQKKWMKEHEEDVITGAMVIGGLTITVVALVKLLTHESSGYDWVSAAESTKVIPEDLPTDDWKWDVNRWVEHRCNGDAVITTTEYIPLDELDEFINKVKESYKEKVCFVVDGN